MKIKILTVLVVVMGLLIVSCAKDVQQEITSVDVAPKEEIEEVMEQEEPTELPIEEPTEEPIQRNNVISSEELVFEIALSDDNWKEVEQTDEYMLITNSALDAEKNNIVVESFVLTEEFKASMSVMDLATYVSDRWIEEMEEMRNYEMKELGYSPYVIIGNVGEGIFHNYLYDIDGEKVNKNYLLAATEDRGYFIEITAEEVNTQTIEQARDDIIASFEVK